MIATPTGFLSREECRALFARLMAMRTGGGDVQISLVTQWTGSATWAKNKMRVLGDAHECDLTLNRTVRGAWATATTTYVDDTGLRDVLDAAEFAAGYVAERFQFLTPPVLDQPIPHPTLWSDATYGWDAAARTATAQRMIAPADAANMLAAGELKVAGQGHAVFDSHRLERYYPVTTVECSMTVRDSRGTASGWAGVNHYDLAKIDPAAIAARALEKCVRSTNPVAIEPGRYTTILEPQAAADLVTPVVERLMDRQSAEEEAGHAFHYAVHQSQIGQRVLDARLNLSADPMDPEAGFVPFDQNDGTPYRAVTWIDRGMLRELSYDRDYALKSLHLDQALLNSKSYILAAAPGVSTTTMEAMIAATERGVLVTRFSGITAIPLQGTLLLTGYTRDGTWLIERGKVTKAIKNLRFTESPLFALNNLLDVGTSVRVFRRGTATMAPAIRVRDFSFTSLADAV